MRDLREQLLKAGLVSKKDVDAAGKAKQSRRNNKKRNSKKEQSFEKPKFTKKELLKQPVNRMLDLSDPRLLQVLQAVEAHRHREAFEGDTQFHFTLRDGRVRKIFVNERTAKALEDGHLAIVENGDADRHVIVSSEALEVIREADAEAVRFHNAPEPCDI